MTRYSFSRLVAEATALPRLTPIRDGSTTSNSSPLSATASLVQTTANWLARSIRRISRGLSPSATASKSTSPAIRERKGPASKVEILRVAVRPEDSRSQNSFVPEPPGARTPIPVITTRLVIGYSGREWSRGGAPWADVAADPGFPPCRTSQFVPFA